MLVDVMKTLEVAASAFDKASARSAPAAIDKTLRRRRSAAGALHEFNPMLGLSRRAPRHRLPRDRRDAGAGHLRGPASLTGASPAGEPVDGRDHGAAGDGGGRDSISSRRKIVADGGGRCEGDGRQRALQGRHHDRAAARGADGGRDREGSAEFFSFGTNDLTQTTLGISRDDAASFLGPYTAKGILPADPFVTLDQEGVGELVAIAAERGRKVRPGIKLGICGEHGGDPASIAFCETLGLDYVSCSPFRVPIARLAAAQAAIEAKSGASNEKHRTV